MRSERDHLPRADLRVRPGAGRGAPQLPLPLPSPSLRARAALSSASRLCPHVGSAGQ